MDFIVKLGNNLEEKKLDIYLILYTRINSYTNLKYTMDKVDKHHVRKDGQYKQREILRNNQKEVLEIKNTVREMKTVLMGL